MTEAVVLNKSDVRRIIAEYYGVEIEKVLPSKYSFTVIKDTPKSPIKENMQN